ncbi:TonB-dependent siderophore receptor [Pantoea sp. BAV 3049]|uniref:TonB-dependent siderophore receptor n=1 Tax=Pantoea sp. BAV 3049 TaxID=2654188 RepID=UPI00131B90B1|nr:TonB-dependent siderophore receptor [Pantoea sp. BAV 3049]
MTGKWKVSRYFAVTLCGLSVSLLSTTTGAETVEETVAVRGAEKSEKQTVKDDENDTLIVTAMEQVRQAPGVSVITAEDIRKHPPANDLADLIRTMPGVNLTGNSNSGSRGNNRQIDLRGMGPENTLILVDGKPISSRSAVRYGWRGERDTRGDTNWVPAEMIERIEVLRGPAAALYGNGAAGGVINIITRQPTDELHGSLNAYMNFPEHKSEGATKRTDFSLMGGLTDNLSFRLYGNINKTQADAVDINAGHQLSPLATNIPAGREGVRNKDINSLLRWTFMPHQTLELEAGFSRQGNIYAGDTENNNSSIDSISKYGQETNRMYRHNYTLTHRGYWESGLNVLSWLQYENTHNTRISEALAGGPAGRPQGDNFTTITLDAFTGHSEINIPFNVGFDQTATLGMEWSGQKMTDPSSTKQSQQGGAIPGYPTGQRSESMSAQIASVFAEDNVEVTSSMMVTPGLRFNHHSQAGNNWSPSLNVSQEMGDDFTLKLGIARAYKAPNLYQLNPDYLLYSRGNGCSVAGTNGCYLMGNKNLKAETSINKEIGVEFHRDDFQAGVTWFRNDYRNKIESGTHAVGSTSTLNSRILQWENVDKSLVEGLEGTLNFPVSDKIKWNNNLTWMLKSENKTSGDYLSITPQFTLNSSVSLQATEDLSLQAEMAWYGRQKPKKYNYKGEPTSGVDRHEVSPYAVIGLSGTYDINKYASMTVGVDNLFDKRQFRAGSAQSVSNTSGGVTSTVYGAGAATYNEPGRTYYVSLNTHF